MLARAVPLRVLEPFPALDGVAAALPGKHSAVAAHPLFHTLNPAEGRQAICGAEANPGFVDRTITHRYPTSTNRCPTAPSGVPNSTGNARCSSRLTPNRFRSGNNHCRHRWAT